MYMTMRMASISPTLPRMPKLQSIQRLQAAMSLLPQADVPKPNHWFADGMYAREFFMPKDVVIVGKIHRFEHLCVQVYGDVDVYSEQRGRERIEGYRLMVSPAGSKRVLWPHANSLWITLHRADTRDVATLERELVEDDDLEAMAQFMREARAALECESCPLLP